MKKFISLLISTALILSLVGCGESKTETTETTETVQTSESTMDKNDTLAKIKEKGELILATSPDYPPYEFKIMEDGKEKIVGFDIDIANEIAKDIGVELRVSELDFNGLLVALNANKADMVMAGMTPSQERMEAVDFSQIYYVAEQGIMVSAENKDTLNTMESLAGKKVGVQKGSIQEMIATEQLKDSKLVSLVKIPNIILELKTGNIDAAIIELPVANGYIKRYPEFTLSEAKIIDEDGGSAIAVKKGDEALVEQINKTIKRLEEEGKIEEFVFNANEIVDGMVE